MLPKQSHEVSSTVSDEVSQTKVDQSLLESPSGSPSAPDQQDAPPQHDSALWFEPPVTPSRQADVLLRPTASDLRRVKLSPHLREGESYLQERADLLSPGVRAGVSTYCLSTISPSLDTPLNNKSTSGVAAVTG